MPYNTFFEITNKPFEWKFAAFGLIFLAIGIVFVKFAAYLDRYEKRLSFGLSFGIPPKILGWFLVIFASFWTLVALGSSYSWYQGLVQAYRTGNYSVAEG